MADSARRRLAAASALGLARPGLAAPSAHRPARLERRTVTVGDGTRLSVLHAHGADPGRTPVLFVPGWCLPADLWRAQLERIAATRPAWALDPRGQGESAVPAQGYDADRRAADLHEVLASLPAPAILVAWSLAGIEVLHGLPRHGPQRIAGLVLVDSSVGEGPAGTGAGVAAFREALRADRRAALTGFARAVFARPQPQRRIDALVDAMSRVPFEASLAMLDYGLSRERLRDAARALPRPLLLAITPQYREQARLHAAARPATRVEVFEHAGHALFDDEPERFAALLAGFAAQVDRHR
jgi:non-heme chloroperoxidase